MRAKRLSTFGAMKSLFFILSMIVSVAVIAQGQGTPNGDFRILSLEECIKVAWESNLNVKQAELGFVSAEAQLKRTKSNVLPNLNGFASHNYNWGQRIDPFTNQFANQRVQSNSFGLSSDITLFNGLQNVQNIRAQQASLEAAEYDLETQKNNMALSVSGAYLNILLSEELIEAAQQQVNISKAQVDRTQKLVEAGSVNVGQFYELEAQLARDKSNLIQRENDYMLAKLQLKQFLLLPADKRIELVKPKELGVDESSTIESSNTLYGYAESSMPEIKSASANLERTDFQLKSSKSALYPSLSLSGSIGTGYSGLRTDISSISPAGNEVIGSTASGEAVLVPTFNTQLERVAFQTQLSDNFNQFVGLSLNVPIFNRNAVSNNVKQAEISKEIAELGLEQEKLALRQRIESARADAMASKGLYVSAEEAFKSTQKAFDFAQVRFEAGALNVTDFNNSKNNLLISQSQLLQSKYDFVFKLRILDFYMGKPLTLE